MAYRQGWLLAAVLAFGCGIAPNPEVAPFQLGEAPGATQPENLPGLGGQPATEPLTGSRQVSFAPSPLAGPAEGGSPTSGTAVPTAPGKEQTITTEFGTYTKRAYKRQPGELVVYIPTDAGHYAPILQRLVAEGVPVDEAIAGAIADARKISPGFGKIVAEVGPLNPGLRHALAKAKKESGTSRPKLVIIELERR